MLPLELVLVPVPLGIVIAYPGCHVAREGFGRVCFHGALHPYPAVEERAVQRRPVWIRSLELVVEECCQCVPVHVGPGYKVGDECVFEGTEVWETRGLELKVLCWVEMVGCHVFWRGG